MSAENALFGQWRNYRLLADELTRRAVQPTRHPSFVLYFIAANLGFGAVGIWVELHSYVTAGPEAERSLAAIRTALLTYVPAVAGTAAMQLVWETSAKHTRALAVTIALILAGAAIGLFPKDVPDSTTISLGLLAAIGSLTLWWLANADQATLLDDPIDPQDAVGGDIGETMLPGDTSGFKVE